MNLKFFLCNECNKIISVVKDSNVPTFCCGYKMNELKKIKREQENSLNCNIPIIKVSGDNVSVTIGSELDSKENENYIEWILIESDKGVQEKWLHTGNSPHLDFAIMTGEKIRVAYEITRNDNTRFPRIGYPKIRNGLLSADSC